MSGESSAGRKECVMNIFLYYVINIAVIDVWVCGMVIELNILNGETL
jgi:hypothetical protein